MTGRSERKVVRRYQDETCATGDELLVDDRGDVWRPVRGIPAPQTGTTLGELRGGTIHPTSR